MSQEILTLRSEVERLEAEIERFSQEKELASVKLNELKNQPDPPPQITESEPELQLDSESEAPPAPIYHNHFDPEVARILEEANRATKKSSPQETANILYENIFRFTGITAFPINKALLSADEEIFGIRFDTYSNHERRFVAPHYVILKKIPHEKEPNHHRWSVFRHTLPVYIPVNEAESVLEYGQEEIDKSVVKFSKLIYGYLSQTQMKHDIFAAVSLNPHIRRVEKDLACHRVRLFLESGQELVIHCDSTSVILAEVVGNNELSTACEAVLTTDIAGLEGALVRVLGMLHR